MSLNFNIYNSVKSIQPCSQRRLHRWAKSFSWSRFSHGNIWKINMPMLMTFHKRIMCCGQGRPYLHIKSQHEIVSWMDWFVLNLKRCKYGQYCKIHFVLYSVAFADIGRTEMACTGMPYRYTSSTEVVTVFIADNMKWVWSADREGKDKRGRQEEWCWGQAGKTRGMVLHCSHTALSPPDNLSCHRHTHDTTAIKTFKCTFVSLYIFYPM